jgi:hypothetical protein
MAGSFLAQCLTGRIQLAVENSPFNPLAWQESCPNLLNTPVQLADCSEYWIENDSDVRALALHEA